MGYDSDYKIEIYPESETESAYGWIEENSEICVYYEDEDHLAVYDSSWCDHASEMETLSRTIPHAIVIVRRTGESGPDAELNVWKNGIVVHNWECAEFPEVPTEILELATEKPKTPRERLLEVLEGKDDTFIESIIEVIPNE
ncbi:hypothetical protein AHIS1_p040 [Acaryochloris phage A-HIS1]|nr:hypothetical protein AHIS1_p040 [Acaryochloris phage A-HIS1]